MTSTEKHDIALTASKCFIKANMPEYIGNKNGYEMLVGDLLDNYHKALKQIERTLPNLN